MSDCGVCVFSGFEGEANDFVNETIQQARKPYLCCECGKAISVGEKYEYARGASSGSFWAEKTCLICMEVRDAFCCDGWIYGELWNGMHEVMGQLTTSCFDKLSTPAAKADLRERWMRWKGLTV
jgi:hypothetical protein